MLCLKVDGQNCDDLLPGFRNDYQFLFLFSDIKNERLPGSLIISCNSKKRLFYSSGISVSA